jgi:hypothetical protein
MLLDTSYFYIYAFHLRRATVQLRDFTLPCDRLVFPFFDFVTSQRFAFETRSG